MSFRNVPPELLSKLRTNFRAQNSNIIAMNAICRNDMASTLIKRDVPLDTLHVFSDKIELEGKATSQMQTGRCWIFAALNSVRISLMKKYKLEEFEFSQSYIFWCDKIERSNYFLEAVLQTLDQETDGRLVQFLLTQPVQDGGQWDMVVNLITKYGLMPKAFFPESFHGGNSQSFNRLLTSKLREYARDIRAGHKAGKSLEQLVQMKEDMMSEIYRIITITLGEPPATFDWCFRDKDKKFLSFPGLTPLTFFRDHVGVNLDETVSLVHDPRHDYYQLYTVEFLGNVVGGKPVIYVNLPIEEIKKYAMKAIQAGKPVWFGCDVGKFSHRPSGILDTNLFDYDLVYGVQHGLDKADRLRFGESAMTHAMVLTAVHLVDEKPIRWRIENSWGDNNGDKGYFSMSDAWYNEFLYQIVVEKADLDKEVLDVLKLTPSTLPAWDPMGALA